ncbi:MAG TPA: methenyltetrahydromethanopterin cyclohydrolase [Methylomirabilota bacterium]|nr:methenyltetrahydromethanopterin cyclohydrolase [Methylomirabilota bacterium]
MGELNLNQRAARVAEELVQRADALGVAVHHVGGATVIDAGVKQPGSPGAGLMLARACLADLGTVQLVPGRVNATPLPAVAVSVDQPVAACLASQYAGWQISAGKYFAMGSGPMRAAYGKEELFKDIGLREPDSPVAVGVLEGKLPAEEAVAMIAQKCRVAAPNLTLLCARTASLAGCVQIVARSVETALHKLHALKFDLSRIVAGFGVAPLPPVARDDLAGVGRTNDAVLYGAEVTLYVTGDDDSLADAARQLPSLASKDYGRPFGEVFARAGHDFYKIDPMLFSPAAVCLQNVSTGRSHAHGAVNPDVLAESFFG